jgi:hypothetical protein
VTTAEISSEVPQPRLLEKKRNIGCVYPGAGRFMPAGSVPLQLLAVDGAERRLLSRRLGELGAVSGQS